MSVHASLGHRSIPTYPLGAPEKNPLFFEKRVYQDRPGRCIRCRLFNRTPMTQTFLWWANFLRHLLA